MHKIEIKIESFRNISSGYLWICLASFLLILITNCSHVLSQQGKKKICSYMMPPNKTFIEELPNDASCGDWNYPLHKNNRRQPKGFKQSLSDLDSEPFLAAHYKYDRLKLNKTKEARKPDRRQQIIPGRYGFMSWATVAVYIRVPNYNNPKVCSGVVIDAYAVLTSSCCLPNYPAYNQPAFINQTEFYVQANYDVERPYQHNKIISVNNYVHYNSLAILILNKPMYKGEQTDKVKSICLPATTTSQELRGWDMECYVGGFGVDSSSGQHFSLVDVRPSQCPESHFPKLDRDKSCYQVTNHLNDDQKIRPLCRADLGAPLMCRDKKSNRWTLLGISLGPGESYAGRSCDTGELQYVSHFVDIFAIRNELWALKRSAFPRETNHYDKQYHYSCYFK